MRIAFTKNRRAGACTLTIRIGRNETLDAARAQWLALGQPGMLPFRYESVGVQTLVYYDVTNCRSLSDTIKTPLNVQQYVGMLIATLAMLEQCEAYHIDPSTILWDPRYIFINPRIGYPQFAMVPIIGAASTRKNARTLISRLAQSGRIRFTVPEGNRYPLAVADFLKRNPSFTSGQLRNLLISLQPWSGTDKADRTDEINEIGETGETGEMLHSEMQDDGETVLRSVKTEPGTGFTIRRLRDGLTVHICAGKATIGRSGSADVHMGGNTNVSRIHAMIEAFPDGRFSITDNHSMNGTEVGGKRLPSGGKGHMISGDTFVLADDAFTIVCE